MCISPLYAAGLYICTQWVWLQCCSTRSPVRSAFADARWPCEQISCALQVDLPALHAWLFCAQAAAALCAEISAAKGCRVAASRLPAFVMCVHAACRHALPPGYVLKSQMKELLEEEAAKNARDITEVIEEERAKVAAKTPITQEVGRQQQQQHGGGTRRHVQLLVASAPPAVIVSGSCLPAETILWTA